MKVQCDVCGQAKASVVCCADEAALCSECDWRIHTANKLASKHQRVALFHPSAEETTRCDICQDKVGYFFCLEDRALLCRSCDYSIHSTNTFTARHKRFLVPGVRVALEESLVPDENAEAARVCPLPQSHLPVKANELLPHPHSFTNDSDLSSPQTAPFPKTIHSSSNNSLTDSQQFHRISSSSPSFMMPQEAPILNAQNLGTRVQKEKCRKNIVSTQGYRKLHEALPVGASVHEAVDALPPHLALVPAESFNHRVQESSSWETQGPGKEDALAHNKNAGSILADERGDGIVRRSTISEYLTKTIPGWRVDELLSFPDALSTHCLTDYSSSKMDSWHCVGTEWQADYSTIEELIMVPGPAEVPTIPSSSTSPGALRSTRSWALGKPMKPSDGLFEYDNTLTVPDISGITHPLVHFLPPLKKQRLAVDL